MSLRAKPKKGAISHPLPSWDFHQHLSNYLGQPQSSGITLQTAPHALKGITLKPFQVDGVDWMLESYGKHGAILADDMGLGKTIQVLAYISSLLNRPITQDSPPSFLILSPLSVLDSWATHIESYMPDTVTFLKYVGGADERADCRSTLSLFRDHCIAQSIANGTPSPGPDHPAVNIILTTYELALRDVSFFSSYSFTEIILDEAHRIKSPETQMFKILLGPNDRLNDMSHYLSYKRILMMTGTPIQNTISEIYPLIHLALPSVFPLNAYPLFIHYFNQLQLFNFTSIVDDSTTGKPIIPPHIIHLVTQLRILFTPFMLRRTKSQADIALPPKTNYVLYSGLTSLQCTLYQSLLTQNAGSLLNCLDKSLTLNQIAQSAKSLSNAWISLRKVINHPYLIPGTEPMPFIEGEHLVDTSAKLVLLDRVLKRLLPLSSSSSTTTTSSMNDDNDNLNGDHRILIFSTSVQTLDIIQDYCALRKWDTLRLDGSVRGDDRNSAIKTFQQSSTPSSSSSSSGTSKRSRSDATSASSSSSTDNISGTSSNNDPRIFLLSTRSGGAGITLNAADVVIFYDSDFNYAADMQAEQRCYRIGQTRPVLSLRLVCQGSLEHLYYLKSLKKMALADAVLQENRFSCSPTQSASYNTINVVVPDIPALADHTIDGVASVSITTTATTADPTTTTTTTTATTNTSSDTTNTSTTATSNNMNDISIKDTLLQSVRCLQVNSAKPATDDALPQGQLYTDDDLSWILQHGQPVTLSLPSTTATSSSSPHKKQQRLSNVAHLQNNIRYTDTDNQDSTATTTASSTTVDSTTIDTMQLARLQNIGSLYPSNNDAAKDTTNSPSPQPHTIPSPSASPTTTDTDDVKQYIEQLKTQYISQHSASTSSDTSRRRVSSGPRIADNSDDDDDDDDNNDRTRTTNSSVISSNAPVRKNTSHSTPWKSHVRTIKYWLNERGEHNDRLGRDIAKWQQQSYVSGVLLSTDEWEQYVVALVRYGLYDHIAKQYKYTFPIASRYEYPYDTNCDTYPGVMVGKPSHDALLDCVRLDLMALSSTASPDPRLFLLEEALLMSSQLVNEWNTFSPYRTYCRETNRKIDTVIMNAMKTLFSCRVQAQTSSSPLALVTTAEDLLAELGVSLRGIDLTQPVDYPFRITPEPIDISYVIEIEQCLQRHHFIDLVVHQSQIMTQHEINTMISRVDDILADSNDDNDINDGNSSNNNNNNNTSEDDSYTVEKELLYHALNNIAHLNPVNGDMLNPHPVLGLCANPLPFITASNTIITDQNGSTDRPLTLTSTGSPSTSNRPPPILPTSPRSGQHPSDQQQQPRASDIYSQSNSIFGRYSGFIAVNYSNASGQFGRGRLMESIVRASPELVTSYATARTINEKMLGHVVIGNAILRQQHSSQQPSQPPPSNVKPHVFIANVVSMDSSNKIKQRYLQSSLDSLFVYAKINNLCILTPKMGFASSQSDTDNATWYSIERQFQLAVSKWNIDVFVFYFSHAMRSQYGSGRRQGSNTTQSRLGNFSSSNPFAPQSSP